MHTPFFLVFSCGCYRLSTPPRELTIPRTTRSAFFCLSDSPRCGDRSRRACWFSAGVFVDAFPGGGDRPRRKSAPPLRFLFSFLESVLLLGDLGRCVLDEPFGESLRRRCFSESGLGFELAESLRFSDSWDVDAFGLLGRLLAFDEPDATRAYDFFESPLATG